MDDYIAAIDAGTGSGRCVIFDMEGRQIAVANREWGHATIPSAPGSRVFDTEGNWNLLCQSTREAIDRAKIRPEQIRAVSATSMREGMILYDRDGKEIWACPNADARGGAEAVQLIKNGLARKIYFTGGDWTSMTSPPRFLWIKRHQPDIFKKMAHMTMIGDWILYRLSGRFVTDPSLGSSSDLFDLSKRTWSEKIIDLCGLRREIFPEVYEPGTIIGKVTPRAERETGLKGGTPVVAGGADTQLGLVGIGAVRPFKITAIGGSFWQQTVVTGKPVIDPKIRTRTLCHSVPNLWMTEGIGFFCGITMRWFRDAFCEYERELAKKEGVDPYYLLEKQAATVPPGSNGIIPIFADVMNARRWLNAAPSFMQFNIEQPMQSGKKECFRAIEESAAYVAYGHQKIIESVTRHKPKEIVFCGGASKGFLWPQILADVFGVTVRVPVVKEATALGTAICAGAGAGLYPDIPSTAERLVKWERTFEPNQDNHAIYTKTYERWRRVYAKSLEFVEEGLLSPLWRGAGA